MYETDNLGDRKHVDQIEEELDRGGVSLGPAAHYVGGLRHVPTLDNQSV
jgi:hypothetical protein